MIKIEPIDPASREYDDLMQCRGALMTEWLAAWNRLHPDERDLCTHPVWICAFMKSVSETASWTEASLNLYTIRSGDELVSCVPLMSVPTGRFLPGHYVKSPKLIGGSSIAMPVEMAREIVQRLFDPALWNGNQPLAVIFDRVDISNMALLNTALKQETVPDINRILLRLDQGYEHILANLNRKTRKNINKNLRQLDALGDFTVQTHTDHESSMQALARYIELESRGWKKDSPYALVNHPFNRQFYLALVDAMARLGHAVINELWFDGTLLASEVALRIGDTHYSVKITYNEDYADRSPGVLLTARVLSELVVPQGYKELNCISESHWFKKVWRADSRSTVKCLLFADSPGGAMVQKVYNVYGRIRSFGSRQEES